VKGGQGGGPSRHTRPPIAEHTVHSPPPPKKEKAPTPPPAKEVEAEEKEKSERAKVRGKYSKQLFWAGTKEQLRLRTQLMINDTSKVLRFDPHRIKVEKGNRKMTVNGKLMDSAGTADLRTGKITLWERYVGPHTTDVLAHEIMHQKFELVRQLYELDREAMQKDSRKGVFSATGGVGAKYVDDYPTAAYLHPFLSKTKELREGDGVTDYSRLYWDALKKGEGNYDIAMHETLAEISKLHWIAGAPVVATPAWKNLYHAVNAFWDKHLQHADLKGFYPNA